MIEFLGRTAYVVLGALLLFLALPGLQLVDDPRPVFVERETIIEREPPARPPTIIERLVFVAPRPVRHQIATGGAALEVAEFCRPSVTQSASRPPPAPRLLLRSVVYQEPPLFRPFQRAELLVTGVTSYGDLEARDYRVRGSFDARAAGGDVVVRYGRFGWLRDAFEGGSQLWAIYSLGQFVWGLAR